MKRLIAKILLIFILIILLFLLIQKTYSTFYSAVDGDVLIDVAAWNISVNELGIANSKTIDINEITWVSNHSNPNTVAPGSVGTFYISIDPNDTSVAIKYDITFNDHSVDSEKILTVTDVSFENGEFVQNSSSTYEGIFTLDDIDNEEVHLIKVTVEWINDEENNESDSLIGLNQKEPDYLDITFKASQFNG